MRARKHGIQYKGVYACRVSGGWQAQISVNGVTHHLGVFTSAVEAAQAYDEQARLLGRRLNFEDPPPMSIAYGFPASGGFARPGGYAAPIAPQAAGASGHAVGMRSVGVAWQEQHQQHQQSMSSAWPEQRLNQSQPVQLQRLDLEQQGRRPPQEWVGVPLGEHEIAAFWRGAGSISLLAQQGVTAPQQQQQQPQYLPPLPQPMGPLWSSLLGPTEDSEEGAPGSFSSSLFDS